MKGLSKRSGLTYALKFASDFLKMGFGNSRAEVFKENGRETPYIHSYSTFNRYLGIAKEFVGFAKSNGVNRLDKVDVELVEIFLCNKTRLHRTVKTIKTNLAALKKFFAAVHRPDIVSTLDENYNFYLYKAAASGRTMPFDNPTRVISKIKSPVFQLVAELQVLTAARIGDVKKIDPDESSMKVIIDKSKGGRFRAIDYIDRPEKFQRIVELKNHLDKAIKELSWDFIRKNYYPQLRSAVKRSGDLYTGSHGFRANYATERYEELTEIQGLSRKVALKIITEELGHSRISQARHYIFA